MSWQTALIWLCICVASYVVGMLVGSRTRRNKFHRYAAPPDSRDSRSQWNRMWRI